MQEIFMKIKTTYQALYILKTFIKQTLRNSDYVGR